jgi:hypothetical protein
MSEDKKKEGPKEPPDSVTQRLLDGLRFVLVPPGVLVAVIDFDESPLRPTPLDDDE